MESHQGTAADTMVSLFPAAILLQHTSEVINTLTAARRLTPCWQPGTVTDKHTRLTLHTELQHTAPSPLIYTVLNQRGEMTVLGLQI